VIDSVIQEGGGEDWGREEADVRGKRSSREGVWNKQSTIAHSFSSQELHTRNDKHDTIYNSRNTVRQSVESRWLIVSPVPGSTTSTPLM
jgi:hypothetical protein